MKRAVLAASNGNRKPPQAMHLQPKRRADILAAAEAVAEAAGEVAAVAGAEGEAEAAGEAEAYARTRFYPCRPSSPVACYPR